MRQDRSTSSTSNRKSILGQSGFSMPFSSSSTATSPSPSRLPCVCVCMCVRIYVYDVYMHTCVYVCVCVCARARVCMCMTYVHVHTSSHACIYVYKRTHKYLHTIHKYNTQTNVYHIHARIAQREHIPDTRLRYTPQLCWQYTPSAPLGARLFAPAMCRGMQADLRGTAAR